MLPLRQRSDVEWNLAEGNVSGGLSCDWVADERHEGAVWSGWGVDDEDGGGGVEDGPAQAGEGAVHGVGDAHGCGAR